MFLRSERFKFEATTYRIFIIWKISCDLLGIILVFCFCWIVCFLKNYIYLCGAYQCTCETCTWSELKLMKYSPFWCKTCFLAAILVTFKKLEAGWLFNLQHGDSLSVCLSVCLSLSLPVSPSPSPSPSLSIENYLKRLVPFNIIPITFFRFKFRRRSNWEGSFLCFTLSF